MCVSMDRWGARVCRTPGQVVQVLILYITVVLVFVLFGERWPSPSVVVLHLFC